MQTHTFIIEALQIFATNLKLKLNIYLIYIFIAMKIS